MARLRRLGARVTVLLCTAGEASHPDSPTTTPEQLAAVRLQEFGDALDTPCCRIRTGVAVPRPAGRQTRRAPGRADRRAAAGHRARRRPGAGRRRSEIALVAPYRPTDTPTTTSSDPSPPSSAPRRATLCSNTPSGTGSGRTPADPAWQSVRPAAPGAAGSAAAAPGRARPRRRPWPPTRRRSGRCPASRATRCCCRRRSWRTLSGPSRRSRGSVRPPPAGRPAAGPYASPRATRKRVFDAVHTRQRRPLAVHHQLVRTPQTFPHARGAARPELHGRTRDRLLDRDAQRGTRATLRQLPGRRREQRRAGPRRPAPRTPARGPDPPPHRPAGLAGRPVRPDRGLRGGLLPRARRARRSCSTGSRPRSCPAAPWPCATGATPSPAGSSTATPSTPPPAATSAGPTPGCTGNATSSWRS